LKLKSLMVITLVVLGCSFAAAQAPGTYSFWDAAGTLEYCNYNVITTNSGGVVAGYDAFTNCGGAYNSAVVGYSATTPADGLPAHGKGAVVGDSIYDASCECFSGEQWTVWQSAKTSKLKKGVFSGAYGWIGVAGSYTGTYFGDNYGYLGAGYPQREAVAGHGSSAGTSRNLIRK
jgi:hypothetical protein